MFESVLGSGCEKDIGVKLSCGNGFRRRLAKMITSSDPVSENSGVKISCGQGLLNLCVHESGTRCAKAAV